MQHIVEELLELSRIESSNQAGNDTVNVHDMLNSIVSDAKKLSQNSHNVKTDIGRDIYIKGQFKELMSAFSNSIFNAIYHTPPGTLIEVLWQKTDAGAKLTVRDNGPGVDEKHLPRLTERFYRVDSGRIRDENEQSGFEGGYGTGLG